MPLEKSQERPSLSENTERLSRPGLRLTDELELRFLENLREHGRTKGTISTYRRNLSKLRKYLPEDRLSLQLAVGTVGAGLFPRHRK